MLGKSLYEVALAINVKTNTLDEERKVNPRLKDALNKYEFNRKQKDLHDLRANPTADIKRLMFESLMDEFGSNSDNEIVIREV